MSPGTTAVVIGSGQLVSGNRFEGEIARAESVEAVLALLGSDLSGTVLLTEQASATAFAPILPMLGGVICTGGGPATHLAIVSRGLNLPCVMQAALDAELAPGDRVSVDDAGTVRRA
jgi:phosphohistidine swiveling domain-containing protein